MKKLMILSVSTLLLLSSCGTTAGSGAYAGATFGSIIGSAIGGIGGGPRGHDIGTLMGMAGGAVIGGAIGNAQEQKKRDEIDQRARERATRAAIRQQNRQSDDAYNRAPVNDDVADYGSGFDENNSGDDRIFDFDASSVPDTVAGSKPETVMPLSSSVENLTRGLTYTPSLEIRNARFVDADGDNAISRGELCQVVFEVYNHASQPVYDVQPMVVEATGNTHIAISPSVRIEKINPGRGIRYTAMVKADRRLKDGSVKLCVSVTEGGNRKISKVSEFNIATKR